MFQNKWVKRVGLGLITVSVIVGGAAAFSAFEAHVINVTARIENALTVDTTPIDFGTVFPQEQLDETFDVTLSQSFQDEDRVDDVEYMIRQKPKCFRNAEANQELPPFGRVTEVGEGEFVCVDSDNYTMLPLLCPYLSKHEQTTDGTEPENDTSIAAFHGPITGWNMGNTLATQVLGRLAKSIGDIIDTWNIDLKVPCFEGQCAQDWEEYVLGINPTAIPANYIQPNENEHKQFGCDLWLEVYHISLPGLGCEGELDLMLVLDRSGSIDGTELGALKSAASAFANSLMPAETGNDVHMGQSSFSSSANLDEHLTDVQDDILAAINGISSGGTTNLAEGIDLATAELDDLHIHERAATKDVMVIITDGNPNVPDIPTGKANAIAEADAARAAGIEVFVVGVGGDVDATFLSTEIADDASHYFSAADFDDLQAALEDLIKCEEAPI